MKRIFAGLLAFLMALCFSFTAFADGMLPVSGEDLLWEETLPTLAEVSNIPAPHAILMDAASGKVLFEKDADAPLPPASITKVMTMILVMEALERGDFTLEDKVVCSEHASSMGGSQIWLEVGEEMTVNDLLKAVAVASANDAAMALAEFTCGSELAFVEAMNEKAKELGMVNTHFVNPTGLDADGHLSSARDIALMSRELLKHPLILEYTSIWTDTLRGGETALTNTNKLVRHYNGCTGLKTGTTDGAGSCLSATAERNGLSLIAVCMGADTSDHRFSSCRTMLDYGFSAFEAVTPELPSDLPKRIPVTGGVEETAGLLCGTPSPVTVEKEKSGNITYRLDLPESIAAPVEEGAELGSISFLLDGETLQTIPLTAGNSVAEMTFLRALFMLFQQFICK